MSGSLSEALTNDVFLSNFYEFLKDEFSTEILICLLKALKLIENYNLIAFGIYTEKDLRNQMKEFFDEHLEEINIPSKILTQVNEFVENEESKADKKYILSALIEVLKLNMVDPMHRFMSKDRMKKIDQKVQIVTKKSKITEVIQNEKEWVFNTFSNYYTCLENQKHDPIIVSQRVLCEFLFMLEKNKDKNFKELSQDCIEEFLLVKKTTLELAIVKLEKLSTEEKLCFYINIYNTLFIHAAIELEGIPYSNAEEYQSFSTIIYYFIEGKKRNLKGIREKIQKYFKMLLPTNSKISPTISCFTLCSFSKGIRVKPLKPENIVQNIIKDSQTFLIKNIKYGRDILVIYN
jgi:hypothetical protein